MFVLKCLPRDRLKRLGYRNKVEVVGQVVWGLFGFYELLSNLYSINGFRYLSVIPINLHLLVIELSLLNCIIKAGSSPCCLTSEVNRIP